MPGEETRGVTRNSSTGLCTVKLIYVLVAHVEDHVGTTMRCHTISLACVESSAAGLMYTDNPTKTNEISFNTLLLVIAYYVYRQYVTL